MKFCVFFMLVLLVSVSRTVSAMQINEFMPAPNDTCAQCSEWIEITSDQNESLENITIDTGESMLTKLNGTIFCGDFIIVTKNASVFSEIWNPKDVIIFENSKMRLTDSRDNITIYNGSHPLQRIEYFNASKNVSYGLCGNVTVQQNVSTPGLPNICASQAENESNATAGNCNVSIFISSGDIFISGGKQSYYLIIDDSNCSEKEVRIEYWIEDLFGNIIKPKYNTTQSVSCSKTVSREWTPDEIKSSEAYYIKAAIADASCNDSDFSNNYDEKLIVVKGTEPPHESGIKIEEISLGSDGKAKFGDAVEVKLNVYRGDTSKSAVDVWLENAQGDKAGKASFNAYGKLINYSLSIPVNIHPNCDGKLPNGTYFLKAEGIDCYDEAAVTIEGSASVCKTKACDASKACSCPSCSSEKKNCTCNSSVTKISGKTENAAKNTTNKTSEKAGEKLGENQTSNETRKEIKIPTGRITAGEDNWFSAALKNVADFFKNLFKL